MSEDSNAAYAASSPQQAGDYAALLKRARAKVPATVGTGERFVMPTPEVIQEGKQTIIRNFTELLDKMNRPAEHVVPLLLRELGTAGGREGDRLILQGKVAPRSVEERVNKYVETYVICGECGRPDTHLVKEERTTIVKCDACGAHRPVKAQKKQAPQKPPEAVEEGKEYEVMIEEAGKKPNEGIARREKYMIVVAGAQKGQVVKIKVNKISGTIAFAEVVKKT